jgi:hypothetical protein
VPELELTFDTLIIALSLQICIQIGLNFFHRYVRTGYQISAKAKFEQFKNSFFDSISREIPYFTFLFLSFLIKKRKRKEGPDDKEDHLFPSLLETHFVYL